MVFKPDPSTKAPKPKAKTKSKPKAKAKTAAAPKGKAKPKARADGSFTPYTIAFESFKEQPPSRINTYINLASSRHADLQSWAIFEN